MRRVVRVQNAVVRPGLKRIEAHLAEAGAEGRALSLSIGRLLTFKEFALTERVLRVVDTNIVPVLLNVSSSGAVLRLEWYRFFPILFVPAAQILRLVKVFDELGTLAVAAKHDAYDCVASPEDTRDDPPNQDRFLLTVCCACHFFN